MITISGDTLTMSTQRFHELLQNGSDTWKICREGMVVTLWNLDTEQVYQGIYLGIDTQQIKMVEV